MSFRLVESGWNEELRKALLRDRSNVSLISPFIKIKAVEALLDSISIDKLRVITRYSQSDFAQGVSDLSALTYLLEHGASVRGVKHLHAKVYLFGVSQAIVTSANLTQAALVRNHEFGFVADDIGIIDRCREYFEDLWTKAGANLRSEQVTKWEEIVAKHLVERGGKGDHSGLKDEGADAGLQPEAITLAEPVVDFEQAFVKFFGESHRRADRSMDVLEEVRRSGCHWACTYPKGKRPRQVRDGALIFMGRMVKEPADILIYGRAIGMSYVEGRDDASPEDIETREWKSKWPHYIRVHHPEFLAGKLANGLSLNAMMDKFGADAYLPTQRNVRRGDGNTNPRKAYRQQAAVALTSESAVWLSEQLQMAFDRYGKLPTAELASLD